MNKLLLLLLLPAVSFGQDRKARLLELMSAMDIPGLSVAYVKNGRLQDIYHLGYSSNDSKARVSDTTIFAAASLSKSVFAYGVMKLVETGRLHLDTPLYRYLEYEDLKHDDRYKLVTARQVLSHTSGLPNWRNGELLTFRYDPAQRFSYSGEGFVFLQRVLEKITAMSVETWMKQNVFVPLKMDRTSYVWQPAFAADFAWPHVELGRTVDKYYPDQPNTAHSLQTTVGDYSKFMIALVNGIGLKKETWQSMFRSQPNSQFANYEKSLAWGLGMGYGTTGTGISFWQWGDNGPFKALMIGYPERKEALVYFANSLQGLSIAKDLVALFIPDEQPELQWLGYADHKDAVYNVLKRSGSMTFREAVSPFLSPGSGMQDTALINESKMNTIANRLFRWQRFQEAIEAYRMNLATYPKSARAAEGLGRVQLRTGNLKEAAAAFEQAYMQDSTRRYLRSAANRLLNKPDSSGGLPTTFTLSDYLFAKNVQLIGSFNEWNDISLPMRWHNGAWRIAVKLKPGTYNYKFLVDGIAVPDPKNKKSNADNQNSIIEVN